MEKQIIFKRENIEYFYKKEWRQAKIELRYKGSLFRSIEAEITLDKAMLSYHQTTILIKCLSILSGINPNELILFDNKFGYIIRLNHLDERISLQENLLNKIFQKTFHLKLIDVNNEPAINPNASSSSNNNSTANPMKKGEWYMLHVFNHGLFITSRLDCHQRVLKLWYIHALIDLNGDVEHKTISFTFNEHNNRKAVYTFYREEKQIIRELIEWFENHATKDSLLNLYNASPKTNLFRHKSCSDSRDHHPNHRNRTHSANNYAISITSSTNDASDTVYLSNDTVTESGYDTAPLFNSQTFNKSNDLGSTNTLSVNNHHLTTNQSWTCSPNVLHSNQYNHQMNSVSCPNSPLNSSPDNLQMQNNYSTHCQENISNATTKAPLQSEELIFSIDNEETINNEEIDTLTNSISLTLSPAKGPLTLPTTLRDGTQSLKSDLSVKSKYFSKLVNLERAPVEDNKSDCSSNTLSSSETPNYLNVSPSNSSNRSTPTYISSAATDPVGIKYSSRNNYVPITKLINKLTSPSSSFTAIAPVNPQATNHSKSSTDQSKQEKLSANNSDKQCSPHPQQQHIQNNNYYNLSSLYTHNQTGKQSLYFPVPYSSSSTTSNSNTKNLSNTKNYFNIIHDMQPKSGSNSGETKSSKVRKEEDSEVDSPDKSYHELNYAELDFSDVPNEDLQRSCVYTSEPINNRPHHISNNMRDSYRGYLHINLEHTNVLHETDQNFKKKFNQSKLFNNQSTNSRSTAKSTNGRSSTKSITTAIYPPSNSTPGSSPTSINNNKKYPHSSTSNNLLYKIKLFFSNYNSTNANSSTK